MSVWDGVVVTPLEKAYDPDADYRNDDGGND